MALVIQHLSMKLVFSHLLLWSTMQSGYICNLADNFKYWVEMYAFRFDRTRNNAYKIKRFEILELTSIVDTMVVPHIVIVGTPRTLESKLLGQTN
jgi:hypothetical protein